MTPLVSQLWPQFMADPAFASCFGQVIVEHARMLRQSQQVIFTLRSAAPLDKGLCARLLASLQPDYEGFELKIENHFGYAMLDEAALREAARHTDISSLEVDPAANTVRISDPLASLDVGALAKGYATERAAQALEAAGVDGYVLNIGGNLRIIGHKPDGSGWTTGIKDPQNTEQYAAKVVLADTSCVTSGNYERYFTVDGVRYHHIIDPNTCMPADYFASVTVITPDSGLADALSTALFCMSYEEGLALVQKLDNVQVLWIRADGTQYKTPDLTLLGS